uniref:Glycoprotein A33 (transmembrane), paralog b n=1 Tax=Salarias fasciatus TaxID=181472 RepID=A0A672IX32_SALFA
FKIQKKLSENCLEIDKVLMCFTRKTVASIFKDNDPDISPYYEGRATMEVDLDQRRSSLTLTETTLEDSRHYQCSVIIPNDDEGNTPRYQAATTSLLVLVAPSTPICSIQGTAEYYQDIKLTCLSEEGSPAPAYEWKSYNVENVPRQLPPKTVQVLSLFNITRETSGFFTCSSTNRVGSASCTFTLAVMPRESHSASLGSVIVSSLTLIYCLCRSKNNKTKGHEARYLLLRNLSLRNHWKYPSTGNSCLFIALGLHQSTNTSLIKLQLTEPHRNVPVCLSGPPVRWSTSTKTPLKVESSGAAQALTHFL